MSGFDTPRLLTGVKAGADLSAKQNRFIKFDGSGDFVVAGAGEGSHILMNAPISGEFVEAASLGGGAELKLAATISAGDFLKSDSNGDAVAATSAGDLALARALTDGVSGDIIKVEPVAVRIHA